MGQPTGYKYGGRTYPGWDDLGGWKWTPDLLTIKAVVESKTSTPYSSVLCNLYRDENGTASANIVIASRRCRIPTPSPRCRWEPLTLPCAALEEAGLKERRG